MIRSTNVSSTQKFRARLRDVFDLELSDDDAPPLSPSGKLAAMPELPDIVTYLDALDRLLTAGRYVIPVWQFNEGLIAHKVEMKYPDRIPLYGDGPNFMPEVWWWDASKN